MAPTSSFERLMEPISHFKPLQPIHVENTYVKIGLLVGLLSFAVYYATRNLEQPFYPGIEIVSTDGSENVTYSKARKLFKQNARELLWRGINSCKGGFQVITTTGPEIILPQRYINEVKNDKRFSLNGFTEKDFFVWYPGFEGGRASVTSNIVQDTVRVKLTQSLNLITNDLCEETDFAVKGLFGESKEWKQIRFMHTAPNLVARLSSRVFLGPEFARDDTWLKIAVRYTMILMFAARELRMWPNMLRPYVHWFLPTCFYLRRQTTKARKMIGKELKKRRAARDERVRKGERTSKTADSLGWMMDLAAERGEENTFDYTGAQLGLTFAAIHTTSDLLTKSMQYLVTYPEYIDALREEMITRLQRDGWKKTTLYQMKLLDSFLKEVQRLSGPSLTAMNRTTLDEVQLSDGTTLPKGASLKVFLDKHFDASIYPSPQTFDPYRFLKMRSEEGKENSYQFVATSDEHAGFGHGMHACPGRFFASNETKIVLCYLLLKYDWKLKDENKKPKNMDLAMETVSDPWVQISYRRRDEEVDLFGMIGVPLQSQESS